MSNNKMIISRRELAIALDKGPIELKIISKRLKNAINLWIKLKEIEIVGNCVQRREDYDPYKY